MTNRIVKLARAITFGLCTLTAACGGGTPETAQSPLAVSGDASSSSRTDGEVETGSVVFSDAGMFDPLALFPGIIELRNSDVTGLYRIRLLKHLAVKTMFCSTSLARLSRALMTLMRVLPYSYCLMNWSAWISMKSSHFVLFWAATSGAVMTCQRVTSTPAA